VTANLVQRVGSLAYSVKPQLSEVTRGLHTAQVTSTQASAASS
jgi:hypothetical protein